MYLNPYIRRAVAQAIRTAPSSMGMYLCHIVPDFAQAWARLLAYRDSPDSGGALSCEYHEHAPEFGYMDWREVRARIVEEGHPGLLGGPSSDLHEFILGVIERFKADRKAGSPAR